MNKKSLRTYAELIDHEGTQTLFRKFDTCVWMFQYNDKGECIGQIRILTEDFNTIANAPSIKAGNATTVQTIK